MEKIEVENKILQKQMKNLLKDLKYVYKNNKTRIAKVSSTVIYEFVNNERRYLFSTESAI
jgi:hypothetical protein